MLTTLSLSFSTAPVIWFSKADNVLIVVPREPPAGFIDWLDPHVYVVAFLEGFGVPGHFYSSRDPQASTRHIVNQQACPAVWVHVSEARAVSYVPSAEVEVVAVKLVGYGDDVRLVVRGDE